MPEAANSATAGSFEPLYPKMLAAVGRHRQLALSVFLIVLMVAAGITFLIPKKYESQVEILLTNERPDLIISPSNGNDTLSSDTVDEVRVNSEIELLRSSDIMRSVVLRCHLSEKHPLSDSTPRTAPSPKMLEQALVKLEHDLLIEPILKTNLIRISYTSESPQLSVDVLTTLTDAYLKEHLAVRGSSETYNFFRQQSAEFARKLHDSQAALDAFRRLHPVTIGDQEAMLLQKKFQTEADLDETESSLEEEAARASFTKGETTGSKIPARIVTDVTTVPNLQAVEQLTNTLTNLKNSRTELLNKFRSDDRVVKVADAQIRQTEDTLKNMEATGGTESATGINPVWQTAQLETAKANLDLAGLKAKSEVLQSQLKTAEGHLQELEGTRAELSVLMMQVKQDESDYEANSRKTEEAHVEDLLDAQRIANVAVVERPVASYISVSPKIGLSLAVSLLLAAFAAAAAVAGVEMFETEKVR